MYTPRTFTSKVFHHSFASFAASAIRQRSAHISRSPIIKAPTLVKCRECSSISNNNIKPSKAAYRHLDSFFCLYRIFDVRRECDDLSTRYFFQDRSFGVVECLLFTRDKNKGCACLGIKEGNFLSYSPRCAGDEDSFVLECLRGEVLIWVDKRVDAMSMLTAM